MPTNKRKVIKKWRYVPVFEVKARTAEEAADKAFDLVHNQFGGPDPIEASDMEEIR